ncbi:hypothetical protein [Burkholderia alba]|uniref:hypothetical protein n=1 Tax=Burkholderia alba TaxID=2683677 RepID=UPI002B05AB18|nr:hypothetical protein [Burkholderia alba]
MKTLIRLIISIFLTIPVFFGLSRIDPLARWVGSDQTWTLLTPVFRLFGATGIEEEEDILLAILLMVSFIIAAALVCGAERYFKRRSET